MTKFLNISTDNTLGGNSPSDETVSSQKAIKDYVDANTGGNAMWGNIVGTLSNQTDLQNQLDDKLNTKQISNCLLEISQDIKLELNNGTLTLKAGSKVYVPNGFESDGITPKFDEITTNSDYSSGEMSSISETYVIFYNIVGGIASTRLARCFSGSTAPTSPQEGYFWYNTTNNVIKRYTSGSWSFTMSFPVCILSAGATSVQVFNGFGYIGSTVFALPGVKGLIPNGRNADGTLKNTEFTIDTVKTYSTSSLGTNSYYIRCSNNYLNAFQNTVYYDEIDNYIKKDNGTKQTTMFAGVFTTSSGVITSLTPKTAFHAVDYNDVVLQSSLAETLIDTLYPVGSVYIGTTATCPLAAIKGTWTLISSGVVTAVNSNVPVKGTGMTMGLETSNNRHFGLVGYGGNNIEALVRLWTDGDMYGTNIGTLATGTESSTTSHISHGLTTDETKSGIVGTVSSTTLSVNIWERTA